jgi:nucleotide-binding universal stress UspA family protein
MPSKPAHAPKPRATRRRPYRRLLVPTDGSAAAARGVSAAIALARALGAPVHALYVAKKRTQLLYGAAGLDGAPLLLGHIKREREARARRLLGEVQAAARRAGVACSAEWVEDQRPWKAMLAVALRRKCDLLVLAPRGALGGLLWTSESARVAARATVSVLLVR